MLSAVQQVLVGKGVGCANILHGFIYIIISLTHDTM